MSMLNQLKLGQTLLRKEVCNRLKCCIFIFLVSLTRASASSGAEGGKTTQLSHSVPCHGRHLCHTVALSVYQDRNFQEICYISYPQYFYEESLNPDFSDNSQ